MKSQPAFIVLALALACTSFAAVVTDGSRHRAGVVPKLESVSSDKDFFGPPYRGADYSHDKQPVTSPELTTGLHDEVFPKGGGKVYPKVQETGFLDHDYVKDENSDGGEWKAQMDYDEARVKVTDEDAMSAKSEQQAKQSRAQVASAQKEADEASAAADKARKEAEAAAKVAKEKKAAKDAAEKAENDKKKEWEDAKARAAEKEQDEANLQAFQDRVKDAEKKYEAEKKVFEQCQKEYNDAKAELDRLQQRLRELEGKPTVSPSETTVEGGISASEMERLRSEAATAKAKDEAAEAALAAAIEREAKAKEAFAKQKAQADGAELSMKQQKVFAEKARAEMEASRLSLRKIRGVETTPVPDPNPKSSAVTRTFSRLLVALLLLCTVM